MINDDNIEKLAQAIKHRDAQNKEQMEMTNKVRNLKSQPYHGNGYYVIGQLKKQKEK